MKIFFEEYAYEQNLVTKIIPGFYTTPPRKGEVKIPYVGYYFNTDPEVMDSVFILPKVFLNKEGMAFGEFDPKMIIDATDKDSSLRKSNYYSEILNLSVWIYRSIAHYIERHSEEDISERDKLQDVISVNGDSSQTYLDTILQLIKFNNEHRNLFTYISKINSRGNNRVHWSKTISHIKPFMQDDEPVYLNFLNKGKTLNVDEELIVLFYSVLDYLREEYSFKIVRNLNYETDVRYVERLIKTGRGTRVMRAMRKKYFTDELVALWKLLNVFFKKAESVSAKTYHDETLLIKNYNLVFEDMIDELISDETREIYPDLKEQDDGKIVDHIYRYGSLIGDDFLYYIGDSKYYKEGNEPGKNSIYKQFTYAKNVIQYNIDIFNNSRGREKKDRRLGKVRYRDELTEGYNITPNFFIRGKVNHKNLNYGNAELKKEDGDDGFIESYHFKNRLFDRDTLFLQKYSINFLYVLNSYASKHKDDNYKEEIRQEFKRDLISDLEVRYKFILLQSKEGNLTEAINKHYRVLNGRIYKSFTVDRIVMFAYERKKKGLLKLLNDLSEDFNLYEYKFCDELDVIYQIHNSKRIIVNPVKKESKKKNIHQLSIAFETSDVDEFKILGLEELAKIYETPFIEDGYELLAADSAIRDFATDLAEMHLAKGADYIKLLKQIVLHKEFRAVENKTNIFATGGERSGDFQNLLNAAQKAVEHGYQVYILPNPKGSRTPDFIFEKRGNYKAYDLKTVTGRSSVSSRLYESIGQSNRVLLNMTVDYNSRLLASDIKSYFQTNPDAIEVLIFKGKKTISVNRFHTLSPLFNKTFRKKYEK